MTLHISAFILISLLNFEIAVVYFSWTDIIIHIEQRYWATLWRLIGQITKYNKNKDENFHRFALSAIREELLESEREKEK